MCITAGAVLTTPTRDKFMLKASLISDPENAQVVMHDWICGFQELSFYYSDLFYLMLMIKRVQIFWKLILFIFISFLLFKTKYFKKATDLNPEINL